MKTHRAISTTARLLAVAVSLSVPAGASAGSLLSGYGGPGQGNQAILGSALVNGPRSGGGSGASSGSSVSGSAANLAAPSTGSQAASTPSATPKPGVSGGKAATRPTHAAAGKHATDTSAGGAGAYTQPKAAFTPQAAVGSSPVLGLSGGDLAYILLAFALLALTAVLTRQMARRPG